MTFASGRNSFLTCLLASGICTVTAEAGLIHRYSFNDGTGKDSVGKVDATPKGDAKIADGKLVLANGEKTSGEATVSYLEFSAPVTPKSGSVSLVVWITAKPNPLFARVLDFGDSEGGEGRAFIYLVPRHEEDQSRAAITATDTGGKAYVTGKPLDDGQPHMAALIIDGAAKKLHLFVDGKESASEDLADNTLNQVRPVHSWLGRSSFDADPGLSAAIDEFRVYDNALSADEVAAAYKAGPDALPPATAPAGGR